MNIAGLIKKIFGNRSKVNTILLVAIILFFVGSGVLNYFQDRRYDNLRQDRDNLKEMKEQLDESVKRLTGQYLQAQESIKTLEQISDSLKAEYVLKELEMDSKEKAYLAEIAAIKDIPPDTIYKQLFVFYPENTLNDAILKYRFSKNQIRGFYSTHKKLEYNLGLNSDLMAQMSNLNFDLRTKDNIIRNKDVQLGTLRTEIQLKNTYLTNLESNNDLLQKSYRKERTMKRVFMGVSAVELGYILFQSLKE